MIKEIKFDDLKKGEIFTYHYGSEHTSLGEFIACVKKRSKNKIHVEHGVLDRGYWEFVSNVKILDTKDYYQAQEEFINKLRLNEVLKLIKDYKWDKFRIIYVNEYFSFECKLNTKWRYLYNPTLSGVESILQDLEEGQQ